MNLPANSHEIVEENCYISSNNDCMLGSCVHCSSPNKFSRNDEEISSNDSDNTDSSGRETNGDQVTYSKWSRIEKKVQKITVMEGYSVCVGSWKERVKSLKQHIIRKRPQATSLIEAKSILQEGHLLMQVDYSESYKNAELNEIQSAYFGHSCFSIFSYYMTDEGELMTHPVTITSESSDHSKIAAFSCVNKILKVMEESINPIKKSLLRATE